MIAGAPVDADTILCTDFTSLADHVNRLEADRAEAQLAQPAAAAMDVDAAEGEPAFYSLCRL